MPVTLHENCTHYSDGWVPDAMYAQEECYVCAEPFGFGVPIHDEEGRLWRHEACDPNSEEE